MLFGGEMAAGMRVLETADASKKIRHHPSEELWRLPDTVTAGDASVSLDAPSRCRTTEELEHVA
jgi:hypothetical protein